MKFAFYFGHPAQFLFVRETIKQLHDRGHQTLLLIKKKDVLEKLIEESGMECINILPEERKNTRIATIQSLLKRNRIMFPILKKFNPDLLVSSDASFAHLGKIMRIPRITILEDDYEVIKPLARLTYPFTSSILCPNVCDVGKWTEKKIGYDGFMKLGYLHPNVFTPDKEIPDEYGMKGDYAIIRLSQLAAYHDVDLQGISADFLQKLIDKLEAADIRPYITSEGDLPEQFEAYKLKIHVLDMHHILAQSSLLISDSQSMSVEAAMLGVPSLRYSDLSGKISVLEELEQSYKLTFGFRSDNQLGLVNKLDLILSKDDFKREFQNRRNVMLRDKIDVTSFLMDVFVNYPIKKHNDDAYRASHETNNSIFQEKRA